MGVAARLLVQLMILPLHRQALVLQGPCIDQPICSDRAIYEVRPHCNDWPDLTAPIAHRLRLLVAALVLSVYSALLSCCLFTLHCSRVGQYSVLDTV